MLTANRRAIVQCPSGPAEVQASTPAQAVIEKITVQAGPNNHSGGNSTMACEGRDTKVLP